MCILEVEENDIIRKILKSLNCKIPVGYLIIIIIAHNAVNMHLYLVVLNFIRTIET